MESEASSSSPPGKITTEPENSNQSSSSSRATDARSDGTLSGSSSSAKSNDLQARRTRAMGDAMQRVAQNKSEEQEGEQEEQEQPRLGGVQVNRLGHGWEQDEARNTADVQALDDTSRALLLELGTMVFSERLYAIPPEELVATKQQDVLRVRDMLSHHSDLNLNIKVLAYGETLLSAAVRHSVDMIQILLEHGADPNLENDMASETAYDQVEEYIQEEEEGEEDSELQQMKQLLLNHGAICFEERMARVQ